MISEEDSMHDHSPFTALREFPSHSVTKETQAELGKLSELRTRAEGVGRPRPLMFLGQRGGRRALTDSGHSTSLQRDST